MTYALYAFQVRQMECIILYLNVKPFEKGIEEYCEVRFESWPLLIRCLDP